MCFKYRYNDYYYWVSGYYIGMGRSMNRVVLGLFLVAVVACYEMGDLLIRLQGYTKKW